MPGGDRSHSQERRVGLRGQAIEFVVGIAGDQPAIGDVGAAGRDVRAFELLHQIAARIVAVAGDDLREDQRPGIIVSALNARFGGHQPALVVGVIGHPAELVGHRSPVAQRVVAVAFGKAFGIDRSLDPIDLVIGKLRDCIDCGVDCIGRQHRCRNAAQVARRRGIARDLRNHRTDRVFGLDHEAFGIDLQRQAVEIVVVEVTRIAARIGDLHLVAAGIVLEAGGGAGRCVERHRLAQHPPEVVVAARGHITARIGDLGHHAVRIVDKAGGRCFRRTIGAGLAGDAAQIVEHPVRGHGIAGAIGYRGVGDLPERIHHEMGDRGFGLAESAGHVGQPVGAVIRVSGDRRIARIAGRNQGIERCLRRGVVDTDRGRIAPGLDDIVGAVVRVPGDIAFGIHRIDRAAIAVVESAGDPVGGRSGGIAVNLRCGDFVAESSQRGSRNRVSVLPGPGHAAFVVITAFGYLAFGIDRELQAILKIVGKARDPREIV